MYNFVGLYAAASTAWCVCLAGTVADLGPSLGLAHNGTSCNWNSVAYGGFGGGAGRPAPVYLNVFNYDSATLAALAA